MGRVGEETLCMLGKPSTDRPHLPPGVIHFLLLYEFLRISDLVANNANTSAVCLWVVENSLMGYDGGSSWSMR